ncbi:MAG: DUF5615 family PIN-like protein [Flavobacteriales bacterium]|nr:DUF5615 family PIN-like protein [Flavobacteriales bacterium]
MYDISVEHQGASDDEVLCIAHERGDLLLTNDKDFGDLVFLRASSHQGVILMRLHGMRPAERIARMVMAIGLHEAEFHNAFTTARQRSIRIRPRS